MNTTDPTCVLGGLRERNRRRTAARLEQAAWELVAERGFDAVTAEAVAERAEVSRRTFFNYYPRVELVLHERMRSTIAVLAERFVARPADEPVQESLAAVLSEPFDADLLEKAVIVFGQATRSIAARHFLVETQLDETGQVEQALLDRTPGVDPMYAQVVARAVMGAGYAATEAWLEQSGGVVDDASRHLHLDLLRQAFAHLFAAFSSPGTPPPGTADAPTTTTTTAASAVTVASRES